MNSVFIIIESEGPKMAELQAAKATQPWFFETFSVVYQAGKLLLWKRNTFQACHSPLALKG